MKSFRSARGLLLGLASCVGLGMAIGGSACGGSNGTFILAAPDAGPDGTALAPGDDAASVSSGATSGSGSPATGDDAASTIPPVDGASPIAATDAAPGSADAAVIDGGLPDGMSAADTGPDAPSGPVAGHISCGNATCDEATQFCCAQADGGASCQTTEPACAALGGVRRQCEKTDDCASGSVCCFDFSSIPATASCRNNDCNGGGGMRVQACRSQGDCASGTCATRSCLVGGSIESCAAFAPECP
jgi:hypothetical protein